MSPGNVLPRYLFGSKEQYAWKETDPKYAYTFTLGWLSAAVAIALFRLPTIAPSVWKNRRRLISGSVLGICTRISGPESENLTYGVARLRRSRLSAWSSAVGAWLLYIPPGLKLDVGQCIVVTSYLAPVAFCILDHPDLKNHPNRPGFIAVAQLPILFLTAAKYNPLFAVLGRGHDKLNFLHRWAGRGVAFAVFIHAFLWVWRRFRNGLACRLYTFQADITGILATIVLTGMVVLSRSQVRRRCYELFFVSHVVGTVLFLVLIFLHAKWHFSAPWLLTPTIVYALDLTLRLIRYRIKNVTLEAIDDQMTLIHIQGCGSGWRAGQHIHVRLVPSGGVPNESHSFSIINAPPTSKGGPISIPFVFSSTPTSATPLVQRTNSDEQELKAQSVITLAARVTGTWTRQLNSLANESTRLGLSPVSGLMIDPLRMDTKHMRVLVDGPYGAPPLPAGERAVMICGGSGAAYVLGVLADWFSGEGDQDERSGVRSILVVWYIRRIRCVRWFARALQHIGTLARARDVTVALRICVTRERGESLASGDGTLSPGGAAKDYRLSTLSELDLTREPYLVASENKNGILGLGLPGSVEFARPCIGEIVQQQVDSWTTSEPDVESDGGQGSQYERLARDETDDETSTVASLQAPIEEQKGVGTSIICCGPMAMVRETKLAVARLPAEVIRRVGGVWLHTEAYEL